MLYDKHTNKQFIIITDRDGNTFYMVIDYDSPINEEEEQYQTYFLNPVDLADLEGLGRRRRHGGGTGCLLLHGTLPARRGKPGL